MYYTVSVQGGTTHHTLAEAVSAAEWQGQFCPCRVVGEDDYVFAEFWPESEELEELNEDNPYTMGL